MTPSLKDQAVGILQPALLIILGVYHFAATVVTALLTGNLALLTNISALREKAFTRLWTAHADELSLEMPAPLDPLVKSLHGRVLDIGPGTGSQLNRYNTDAAVEMIYAAEPAVDLHAELAKNAEKAGLRDRYKILSCGAEPESLIPALAKTGLLERGGSDEGIFDDIVSIRVLCGVPRPEETVAGLYRLLRPGGRLIVCEHVVNPWQSKEGSVLARLAQVVYRFSGWWFLLGGCNIDRDTEKTLKEAGGKSGWKEVRLQIVDAHAAIPMLVGCLVKSD
ncbi:hypothetical protein H2201_004986 [Coniosporium apollinis]|uniref:Methyltransferase type 11 domain-containing protein n=2 Tax=Coniosporium TaxID=2810619 RepID=A0ABQ9NR87_9PEZI|nr:hypothetical protein H2199_000224 [Cladosporium sp. JES 115]KAJ9664934.1 hypothetical protein H2201_004986 [Coniosporium apollinis]